MEKNKIYPFFSKNFLVSFSYRKISEKNPFWRAILLCGKKRRTLSTFLIDIVKRIVFHSLKKIVDNELLNQSGFKLDQLEFHSSKSYPYEIEKGGNSYLCKFKNYSRLYIPIRGHTCNKGAFSNKKTD